MIDSMVEQPYTRLNPSRSEMAVVVSPQDLHPPTLESPSIEPARQASARGQGGGVQSVERALALLEVLAQSGRGTSLTDIAQSTGLNISTCHHLLATLQHAGYVSRIPGRRTYSLGARVLHLGQAFLRQVDVPRRAQPIIEQLGERTGETVHVAVLQGDRVVTVARRESRHAVRVDGGAIGTAEAAHATATGKAILAWLPDQQMERVLGTEHDNGSLQSFTSNTIVRRDVLVEELRLVRRNGYALDREEFQPGVVCVGAAVRDHAGAVIGAISASAPAFRAEGRNMEVLREAVVSAARDLSAEFGAPPPSPNDEPTEAA